MRKILFLNNIFALDLWPTTGLVIFGGLLIIILTTLLLRESTKDSDRWKYWKVPLHHTCRDIGISLVVAAIVTFFYGSMLDFKRVSDAITLMLSENVPESVWKSTTTQILGRKVYRGNYVAKWTVESDSSLPPDQTLLKVHIEYTLYGLKPQPFQYTVMQELENIHLRNEHKDLPRFDKVIVTDEGGERVYEGEKLKGMVNNGLLTLYPPVNLKGWVQTDAASEFENNKGIRIVFERSEIINIPGTFSIVFSELTRNVDLKIEVPENIRHQLKRDFDRGSIGFKELCEGRYVMDDLALPGQGISVQFWRKGDDNIPESGPCI